MIAMNVGKSDILNRLFNLLGLVNFNQKTLIFKKYYVFHHFTLLALLRSTKTDTYATYSRLSGIFKAISTSIGNQKTNREQYQQSVNLLTFYLQQVEQFYEENFSDLEENDLQLVYSDVYKNLLKTMPDIHKNSLYKHINQLILVFITQNPTHGMKQEIFQKLHESFHEPLLTLLNQSSVHVDRLMEIVANLTVLAIQR